MNTIKNNNCNHKNKIFFLLSLARPCAAAHPKQGSTLRTALCVFLLQRLHNLGGVVQAGQGTCAGVARLNEPQNQILPWKKEKRSSYVIFIFIYECIKIMLYSYTVRCYSLRNLSILWQLSFTHVNSKENRNLQQPKETWFLVPVSKPLIDSETQQTIQVS